MANYSIFIDFSEFKMYHLAVFTYINLKSQTIWSVYV